MKATAQKTSIGPAIAELERAFREFASLLFKQQKLELPAITIQAAGRKAAAGWFSHNRWGSADASISEINLCAEMLASGVEVIAEILIHEMVHYANAVAGVRDCSANQYHNKRFRDLAESVGLHVEKGKRGWAYTSLTPDLADQVRKINLDPEAFAMFRLSDPPIKKGSRMKKWSCGCTTVRCATELSAVCSECDQAFELAE